MRGEYPLRHPKNEFLGTPSSRRVPAKPEDAGYSPLNQLSQQIKALEVALFARHITVGLVPNNK